MTAVTILSVVFGLSLWLVAWWSLFISRDESSTADVRPAWFGIATGSAPWVKGHYVERRNEQPATVIRPIRAAGRAYLVGSTLGFLGALLPSDSYSMTIGLFMGSCINGLLWGFTLGVITFLWLLVKKHRLTGTTG